MTDNQLADLLDRIADDIAREIGRYEDEHGETAAMSGFIMLARTQRERARLLRGDA